MYGFQFKIWFLLECEYAVCRGWYYYTHEPDIQKSDMRLQRSAHLQAMAIARAYTILQDYETAFGREHYNLEDVMGKENPNAVS